MEKFTLYKALIQKGFQVTEKIQILWSGYGQIIRMADQNGHSYIVKHIDPPTQGHHPRGWNTNASHQRKLRSYEIEINWYKRYASRCDEHCRIPGLIGHEAHEVEQLLILEDLDQAGYAYRRTYLNLDGIKNVLDWLASFHATFLGNVVEALWPIGTYWHLDTRKEEWDVMENGPLKKHAQLIDNQLNTCRYQTIVHGDAKLANFCFSSDNKKIAAVDFQYVGRGCGIKDVIYFLGSCLSDHECSRQAEQLVDHYFHSLKKAIAVKQPDADFISMEQEWRSMYAFAWADFHRFLLGWMPGHHKLTNYSTQQVNLALSKLPV